MICAFSANSETSTLAMRDNWICRSRRKEKHSAGKARHARSELPLGRTENSPRLQPWVGGQIGIEPRQGRKNKGNLAALFFRPYRALFPFCPHPTAEAVGYFRPSLTGLGK